MTTTDEKRAADLFSEQRRRLFGVAYRMLGSAAEAEDVVQDVWLRWQGTDTAAVLDPAAFLVTVTTRAAINVLQSARARRESYVGPWLPEPIDTSTDPEAGALRREGLEMAVLFLLEKLSPTERAAYVLREAFDYSHARIAEVLHIDEANARQLVTRARKHVTEERRTPVSIVDHRRLLEAFLRAAQLGDRAALEGLLAEGVVSRTDGGGKVRLAARAAVIGRERVAQFVVSFPAEFWTGTRIEWRETNGQPSVLISNDEGVLALASIDASGDGIERIFWVMAPVKLAAILR